ncbi:MAG: transcriptional regulator [Saprospiraceae bacterium]|nr:MAG: transcriptional regulator [Saprospiraceae bacterium]
MATKDKINKIFKVIADPTRREIFHILMIATTALSITQISEQFEISRQGVTKHIKLLEEAGLVRTIEQGRERFCEANPTPLNEIKNWLAVYDKFWDTKLRKLDDYLNRKF